MWFGLAWGLVVAIGGWGLASVGNDWAHGRGDERKLGGSSHAPWTFYQEHPRFTRALGLGMAAAGLAVAVLTALQLLDVLPPP